MFGKNSTGSNGSQNKNSNDEKINLNEDNFQIDEMPIHTMRKDLAELKNPTSKKISVESEPVKKNSLFAEKSKVATPENSGPFFQKETPKPQEKSEIYPPKKEALKTFKQEEPTISFNETPEMPKSNPAPKTPKEISNSPITTTPKIVTNNINKKEEIIKNLEDKDEIDSPSPGIGKAIAIAVVIFIILIAGAGSYYFWMTRISSAPEEFITTEIITPEIQIENQLETPVPSLSSQNSNYLTINLSSDNPQEIRDILNNYTNQVLSLNTNGLFEFLVTDENNTPVTFKDFANAIGINLSPNTLSQIGSDFNFYIYNQNNKTRLGLSVSLENPILAKSSLLNDENDLIQNFTPLYSNIEYTLPLESFAGATYAGAPEAYIRYINITTSEDLSLDYAIIDNQLVIGTTKEITFAILDKQLENFPISN